MIHEENEELRDSLNPEAEENAGQPVAAQESNADAAGEPQADGADTPEARIADLEAQVAKQKDDYLRLMAEFDNYRKSMLKKLQDAMKYGGEEALKGLLAVIDDFERGLDALAKTEDVEATKQGIDLIYQKFLTYLKKNKVAAIPVAQGDAFDESIHDAVTMFPAPDPSLKGKVVDCVEKGYKLDDKVIRYAKVVVGQ